MWSYKPKEVRKGDGKPRHAPLRRPLKRSRTDIIGKLKKMLWEACKVVVRAKYGHPDGTFTCYTCDKTLLKPQDAQTGHFIASSVGGISLRYNLDNLRIQCYTCNIHLGGNGAEFYRRLVLEVGQEKVDSLFEIKKQIVKADRIWYENAIADLLI